MKRSEMIQQINDLIHGTEFNGTQVNAESVLAIVEKAGMLPPPSLFTSTGFQFDQKGISATIENKWEEDD
jgi:hypothetical protein